MLYIIVLKEKLMGYAKYILIHDFDASKELDELSKKLWAKTSTLCPTATPPKLSNHVSIIPPFNASDEVIFALTMGVEMFWAGFTGHMHNDVEILHLPKVFRNADADVLYLPVVFPKSYVLLVESIRGQINNFGSWVHELPTKKFNPHITLAKGKNLFETLEAHGILSGEIDGRRSTSVVVPVNKPVILKKETGGTWTEVQYKTRI